MKKLFLIINKILILLVLLLAVAHSSIIVLKKIKKENLYYVLLNDYQKNNYAHLKPSQVSDLLESTWYRNWEYLPILGFKEGTVVSSFVNVNDFGVRSNDGVQVTYNDLNNSVWFFGGSTTFGYGVEDNNTIPSKFERKSNEKVINFGAGFYYSFQENHLFKKFLKSHKPKYAIFLDGHNESCSINPYQDEMSILFRESQSTYNWSLKKIFEPILFYTNKINQQRNSNQRIQSNPWDEQLKDCNFNGTQIPLTKIVDNNLKERARICKLNNIKCYTFLQPFPRIHVPHLDKSRLTDEAAKSMKLLYDKLEPIFKINDGITLENLNFDSNKHYYIDSSHYSKEASKIIANRIFQYID